MKKIDKGGTKFLTLTKLIEARLAPIKEKIDAKQLDFLQNQDLIVERGTFQNFEVKNDFNEIIELLSYFIELANEERVIRFSLDSRFYSLQIGALYYSLMDKLLEFYLTKNDSIKDVLFFLLNEFQLHLKNMIIPFEIFIPLKGINYVRKSTAKIPDLVFNSKKSEIENIFKVKIEVKIFSDVIIIRNDLSMVRVITKVHSSKEDTVDHAIGLSAKSYIPFDHPPTIQPEKGPIFPKDFLPKEFLSIKKNLLWKELKNIYASFLISNQKIRFGKPFYSFPWWLSKKISRFFEFPQISWMLKTDFPKQHTLQPVKLHEELIIADLIPDLDRLSAFIIPYSQLIGSSDPNIWTSEMGFGGKGWDPKTNLGFQRYKLDFPLIKQFYILLSDERNTINFKKDDWIFERLIRLRQREYIEDAIIDANLILEYFLIPVSLELSYQFRQNAAILTAEVFENISKRVDYFKSLYSLRSDIVHGNDWTKQYKKFVRQIVSYNIDKYNFEELINITQETVIDSIFEKIIMLFIRIIEINEVFPDFLKKVENIVKLARKIKDKSEMESEKE